MLSSNQHLILQQTITICSILSLIASCVICLKYYWFPRLRTRSAKLVVWLSVSSIGLYLTIIIGVTCDNTEKRSSRLKPVSFLINYFILSIVFWSCGITKTMSLVILQRNKLLELLSTQSITPRTMAVKRIYKFHVIILSLSLVLSIIPLFTDSYADFAKDWYWYKHGMKDQLVGFFCYFLPILCGIVYNGFVFYNLGQVKSIFVDSGMNLGDGRTLPGQLYELAMSLKNYPIATTFWSIWVIIQQIVRLCGFKRATRKTFWLYLLVAILQSSQGVVHIAIYFYRSYRRGTLWSRDEGLCGICCPVDAYDDIGLKGNAPLLLAITPNDRGRFDSKSEQSISRPSMLDVERAVDALCPMFEETNDNFFASGLSHGAASDYNPPTVLSSVSGGTRTTDTPRQPASVSVRIGVDSDSSMGSNVDVAQRELKVGKDGHASFGICFED